MSANRPSKYEIQLKDPPPLLPECMVRDPGSFEWYFMVHVYSMLIHMTQLLHFDKFRHQLYFKPLLY